MTMSAHDHIPPCAGEVLLSGTPLVMKGKTVGIPQDIPERAGQSDFVPESLRDTYAGFLSAYNPSAEKKRPRGGW